MCAMPPSHFRRPSRETVVAELDEQEVGELLSRVGYDPDGSGSLDEEELAAVYLEMGSGDAVDLPEFEEWWKRQPKAMLALKDIVNKHSLGGKASVLSAFRRSVEEARCMSKP